MAASPAPADDDRLWGRPFHRTLSSRSDPNLSNEDEQYRSLEVGITSLSLLSAAGNSNSSHNRKGTGSTVSSYSPPEFLTPSSPRPPSAPKAMPSPICKPIHNVSNATSSTSPSLTLTPNSSDGNPESFGSHIVHAPPLPYLQAPPEHRRNDSLANSLTGSIGSAPENDGLLGLEALHRDHGILSSSLGSGSRMNTNQLQPPPPLPSTISSQRPPLSQSYNETYCDRSVGGHSWKSDSYAMNLSLESHESSSNPAAAQSSRSSTSLFGTFGSNSATNSGSNSPHHQLPAHPNYETAARRRASSQDAYYDVASKFGTLQTLSAHKQQQIFEQQLHQQVSKPRHIRSISGPQPTTHEGQALGFQQQRPYFPYANDYAAAQNPYKIANSVTRSASLSNSPVEVSANNIGSSTVPHGVSMPNLLQQSIYSYGGSSTSSAAGHMIDRRDNFDFHISPGNSVNDNVVYGDSSPNTFYYSSHARQGSDNSSMLLSAQSLPAMNSLRPQQLRHHSTSSDDYDNLVGEHIDVPDPYEEAGSGASYMITGTQQQQHPLLRGATHSHSMSLDAIPAPFTSPMLPPAPTPKVVYVVKFKRSQRNFVIGPRISRDLKVGTYVKVEADRGEDLGIVVGKLPYDKFRSSFTAGSGLGTSSANDLKRIVRLATHDEVSLLGMKREEEEKLLQICRTKVLQRGLPMNVVDAEYQFDRHKLTFFFEAEGRVDFRELVRDLFSMYKTRIWMQQLDKNTSTSSPAILAPSTHHDIDYGTPIIAPPSEFADSIINFNSFVGPGGN